MRQNLELGFCFYKVGSLNLGIRCYYSNYIHASYHSPFHLGSSLFSVVTHSILQISIFLSACCHYSMTELKDDEAAGSLREACHHGFVLGKCSTHTLSHTRLHTHLKTHTHTHRRSLCFLESEPVCAESFSIPPLD